MSEFNQQIQNIHREYEGDNTDPSSIFSKLLSELIEQFDILNKDEAFELAKAHMLTAIKTSGLTQNQQDTYADRINDLDDYVRLLMFLDQEIKGL